MTYNRKETTDTLVYYTISERSADAPTVLTSGRWSTVAEAEKFLTDNPGLFQRDKWPIVDIVQVTATTTRLVEMESVA
jgi:hypothetical protein